MDPKEQAAVGHVKLMMASHHIYRAARRLRFAERHIESQGWPSDDLAERRDELDRAIDDYRAIARECGGDRFGEGDLP